MRIRRSESTAALRRVPFQLVDATDGITPELGEVGGQPQISIAGAAWVNTDGVLVVIGNGRYYVELTEAETDYVEGTLIETRYKSAETAEALGALVQITEATNKEIYDRFDEISPLQHFMEASSSVVEGSVVSGTYLLTQIEDGSYWITKPDPVNGLEQILDFDIGTGRVPSLLSITGYWKTTPPTGFADVDIFNHETNDWDQLSNFDTRMDSENSNQDYIYIPSSNHVDPVTGIVQIRLRSVSTGANDRMNLDKVGLDSFTSGSAGLTPANIATAVWSFKPGDVHDHATTAFWLRAASISNGAVESVVDAQNFKVDSLKGDTDIFKGYIILVHDEDTDLYHRGVIASHDTVGNIVLADEMNILPEVGDGYLVFDNNFNPVYDSVDVGTIGGAPISGDAIITGIFQSKVTVRDGRDIIVYTGDYPTLELVAPTGWDFTGGAGKRVFFKTSLTPGGVEKIAKEATVTGQTTAEVELTGPELDVVAAYEGEFYQTDADGVSNPLTIARFRLSVRQDV